MDTPLFSFIMPAYKRQFLAKSIESILSQTYDGFELVVVNDASPENLREVVSDYNDPRLRYEENAGNIGGKDLVANWNHCLHFARGKYVILATDDDIVEPTYLEDAARMLEKYPDVDLLRQGVMKINANDEPIEYELFPKEHLTASEFAYFWGCCGLISCISNFVFRRAALIERGGFISFPHAHYSDVATALSLSQHGVACVQAYNLGFRMSEINLSNRGEWWLALEQLEASGLFMHWTKKYLSELNQDFFTSRSFFGFREQYKHMVENLIGKIPRIKIAKVFTALHHADFLYKKEKLKLLVSYIIK